MCNNTPKRYTKPALPDPNLSRRARTVQLTVRTPMPPPEIDQPQVPGLLLSSEQVNELNALGKQLERNTFSLRQTFVRCTAAHPGRQADRWLRLLSLLQYAPCLAQIRRHREERLRLTLRL